MELFAIPFTCSFAAHVVMLEAGLPHELRHVVRATKRVDDGRDFLTINPKAAVPTLTLADGAVLTESVAVLQYLADAAPEKNLAPRWGTTERYRLVEWLNFVTTELHKKHLWMIFSTQTSDEMKAWARASMPKALEHVAKHLESREFLLGDQFTVADAYLFWALFVAPHGGVSLERWPSLLRYAERIRARPSVKRAFEIESPLYAKERAA